eukprot:jgi/Mesen1/11021/ME000098S10421
MEGDYGLSPGYGGLDHFMKSQERSPPVSPTLSAKRRKIEGSPISPQDICENGQPSSLTEYRPLSIPDTPCGLPPEEEATFSAQPITQPQLESGLPDAPKMRGEGCEEWWPEVVDPDAQLASADSLKEPQDHSIQEPGASVDGFRLHLKDPVLGLAEVAKEVMEEPIVNRLRLDQDCPNLPRRDELAKGEPLQDVNGGLSSKELSGDMQAQEVVADDAYGHPGRHMLPKEASELVQKIRSHDVSPNTQGKVHDAGAAISHVESSARVEVGEAPVAAPMIKDDKDDVNDEVLEQPSATKIAREQEPAAVGDDQREVKIILESAEVVTKKLTKTTGLAAVENVLAVETAQGTSHREETSPSKSWTPAQPSGRTQTIHKSHKRGQPWKGMPSFMSYLMQPFMKKNDQSYAKDVFEFDDHFELLDSKNRHDEVLERLADYPQRCNGGGIQSSQGVVEPINGVTREALTREEADSDHVEAKTESVNVLSDQSGDAEETHERLETEVLREDHNESTIVNNLMGEEDVVSADLPPDELGDNFGLSENVHQGLQDFDLEIQAELGYSLHTAPDYVKHRYPSNFKEVLAWHSVVLVKTY